MRWILFSPKEWFKIIVPWIWHVLPPQVFHFAVSSTIISLIVGIKISHRGSNVGGLTPQSRLTIYWIRPDIITFLGLRSIVNVTSEIDTLYIQHTFLAFFASMN